jgi:hypothetical protein
LRGDKSWNVVNGDSGERAANLIIIDDMMDKLDLPRAKASALDFSIEGEAGRSDP